jgi:hypothetical protein
VCERSGRPDAVGTVPPRSDARARRRVDMGARARTGAMEGNDRVGLGLKQRWAAL